MVEHLLAKEGVASSNLVFRSIFVPPSWPSSAARFPLPLFHIVSYGFRGRDGFLQLLCPSCNPIKGEWPQEYLMAQLAEIGVLDKERGNLYEDLVSTMSIDLISGNGSQPMQYQLNIPIIESEPLIITLEYGGALFILGPNGSGKSPLIQHAVISLGARNVRRISAHRQTWMESGAIGLTPQSRRRYGQQHDNEEPNPMYRWREWNPPTQLSSVMFDLVAKDNDQARRIADHARAGNYPEMEEILNGEPGVFDQINELLDLANLAVKIENSAGENLFARRKVTNEQYDIAQMSDGERNAVILAANVLTVKPGTVLLIDEPERHLHRSIIEPLLSALFARRQDCAFIVSTHEVALPIANPEAAVLVVRSCQWAGDRANAWDAKLIEKDANLPEDVKRAILGSRERILFVEGQPQSLDVRLYSTLFPEISVVPVGGCDDVIKAVEGMRNTSGLHDVEAFGLIDGDNRDSADASRLTEKGIYSLNAYSVESIYFCSDSMNAVAQRQAESLGRDADQMVEDAKNRALDELGQGDLAERMAARFCERKVREELQSQLPDWKTISGNPSHTITLDTGKWHQEEISRFEKLRADKDLEKIIARYPVRETSILERIASAFVLNKSTIETP